MEQQPPAPQPQPPIPLNDDLASHPASMPPDFPRYGTSVLQRAERLSQRLYFPLTDESSVESNVLVSVPEPQVEDDDESDYDSSIDSSKRKEKDVSATPLPSRAYWIRNTIRHAIYGSVRLGIVLRRRVTVGGNLEEVEWEVTSDLCAVKEMEWNRVREGRGRLTESPIQEVKALQYLKRHSDTTRPQHVLVPLDLFGDSRYLYIIQPFCEGGELFSLLERQRDNQFSENEARFWMRQILLGLGELQRLKICHRDISLENLMIRNQRSLVIDFGMCIYIPFQDYAIDDEQSRLGRRQQRLLLKPQGTCGKWHYMAPEIVANQEPFDGFAVDLWAAGVILFIMLLGYPPWSRAHDADERFRYMSRGYLSALLTHWSRESNTRELSAEVMDLLQKMLYKDPQHRLSLRQVCSHPWFQMEE
jgi:hypothetical protein